MSKYDQLVFWQTQNQLAVEKYDDDIWYYLANLYIASMINHNVLWFQVSVENMYYVKQHELASITHL